MPSSFTRANYDHRFDPECIRSRESMRPSGGAKVPTYNGTVLIRLHLTPFIPRPFHSHTTFCGGGEGDDKDASRRDDKSATSAQTNASIKYARSKKYARSNESARSSALNKFVRKPGPLVSFPEHARRQRLSRTQDVAAGKSKKKRGVIGLTLAVCVAAGVFLGFLGLYYEDRKTANAEAAYLAGYNGPWYYDEECLSPRERARNLKGDVKTSSVTVLINKKRDEEGEESLGSVRPHKYITITSHPKHYRKVRYLDL